MKVTVCQWDSRPEALESQLHALAEHCRRNASELLLLPEMPFDDWLAGSPEVDPARWEVSVERHLRAIERISKVLKLSLLGSRPVVDVWGVRRNRAFLWGVQEGLVDGHDKIHLPEEEGYWEARWYQAGSPRLKPFVLEGCLAASLLCSELWFFEHARRYGEQKAHLICLSRATSSIDTDNWIAAGKTAAVVAGAYCLSSNQSRPGGVLPDMAGSGWIIDPDGEVLALTSDAEPFVTLEVDLGYAEAAKATYPRYLK